MEEQTKTIVNAPNNGLKPASANLKLWDYRKQIFTFNNVLENYPSRFTEKCKILLEKTIFIEIYKQQYIKIKKTSLSYGVKSL